jgi:hypothetical protein
MRGALGSLLAASWHSSEEVGHGPRQHIHKPAEGHGRAGRHPPWSGGQGMPNEALEPADVEPSLDKSLLMPAVGIMQS